VQGKENKRKLKKFMDADYAAKKNKKKTLGGGSGILDRLD
jgi:hypothetical protein